MNITNYAAADAGRIKNPIKTHAWHWRNIIRISQNQKAFQPELPR